MSRHLLVDTFGSQTSLTASGVSRNGHFGARDVSCDKHTRRKMVLTRRSAAAIGKQRLKEKVRKPVKLDTEEESYKEESTEHTEAETQPDGAPLAKEDSDEYVEQIVEKMGSDSIESLTAAACSILRRARVDGPSGQVDSDDEEMEEECVEAEGLSGSFMSLSGADLEEEKPMKKKKRMKKELVTHCDMLQM